MNEAQTRIRNTIQAFYEMEPFPAPRWLRDRLKTKAAKRKARNVRPSKSKIQARKPKGKAKGRPKRHF